MEPSNASAIRSIFESKSDFDIFEIVGVSNLQGEKELYMQVIEMTSLQVGGGSNFSLGN